jgi:hypothetical protein
VVSPRHSLQESRGLKWLGASTERPEDRHTGILFRESDESDVLYGTEQPSRCTLPHPHRNQRPLLALRVACKGSRPFRMGVLRTEVVVR